MDVKESRPLLDAVLEVGEGRLGFLGSRPSLSWDPRNQLGVREGLAKGCPGTLLLLPEWKACLLA